MNLKKDDFTRIIKRAINEREELHERYTCWHRKGVRSSGKFSCGRHSCGSGDWNIPGHRNEFGSYFDCQGMVAPGTGGGGIDRDYRDEYQTDKLMEDTLLERKCDKWADCPGCGGGRVTCKDGDGNEVNSTGANGDCGCDKKGKDSYAIRTKGRPNTGMIHGCEHSNDKQDCYSNCCNTPASDSEHCCRELSSYGITNDRREMEEAEEGDKRPGWRSRWKNWAFSLGEEEMDEGCGDGEMYEGGCGGEMYEDDATWTCKNGKCTKVVGKGGVGEFETLQECEDSNCEERARPGGYGGGRDNSMKAMDTQALNEQIVELKKLMVYNPNLTLTEQTKVVNKHIKN